MGLQTPRRGYKLLLKLFFKITTILYNASHKFLGRVVNRSGSERKHLFCQTYVLRKLKYLFLLSSVLSDVEQILLRAQQFDDNLIDTTVSNIQMDTLDVRYSISFGEKTKEDLGCQSVCCVFYLQIDKLLFVVFSLQIWGMSPNYNFFIGILMLAQRGRRPELTTL